MSGLVAGALLIGAAGPGLAQQRPADRDFLALRALDARVATVGYRLAVGGLDLCSAREWRHGFVFLDLAQVAPAFRASANRVFGARSGLGVTALVAGGPAERAGLKVDDVILALDGRAVPGAESGRGRPELRFETMLGLIEAAFADGRADVEVQRGGARLTVQVQAERGCASRFQIIRDSGREAHADGRNVQITLRLVQYVRDDGELAAVIAHEFAHNILGHRQRLQGASSGVIGMVDGGVRRIRETEIEADRLSVYLMERAGFDPEAAVRFWTRFGPHPLNFLRSGEHPNWRARVASLEAEIAAIREARAAGRVPTPAFLAAAPR